MPPSKIILVLLALVLGGGQSVAQSHAADSAEVEQHFQQLSRFFQQEKVLLETEMRLYRAGTTAPVQTHQNSFCKQGERVRMKQLNQETIISPELVVQVDHNYREITLQTPQQVDQKQEPLGEMAFDLSLFSSFTLTKNDQQTLIRLKCPPAVLYDFIDVALHPETGLPQQVTYWSKLDPNGLRSRMEVEYLRLEAAPDFPANTFAAQQFVRKVAEGYQTAPAYHNYTLTDPLTD